MTTRIDYYKTSPEAVKAILGLEGYVKQSSLDKILIELINLRASQINGCAYCVDIHCTNAIKAGETERRLHAVALYLYN
jgi:AhpD family alkylhydroperoxidase